MVDGAIRTLTASLTKTRARTLDRDETENSQHEIQDARGCGGSVGRRETMRGEVETREGT